MSLSQRLHKLQLEYFGIESPLWLTAAACLLRVIPYRVSLRRLTYPNAPWPYTLDSIWHKSN